MSDVIFVPIIHAITDDGDTYILKAIFTKNDETVMFCTQHTFNALIVEEVDKV